MVVNHGQGEQVIKLVVYSYYKLTLGEANFCMNHTSLTIGGFMQPSIARNLLEHPLNVDKGLCQ